jgi:hypothetical protein
VELLLKKLSQWTAGPDFSYEHFLDLCTNSEPPILRVDFLWFLHKNNLLLLNNYFERLNSQHLLALVTELKRVYESDNLKFVFSGKQENKNLYFDFLFQSSHSNKRCFFFFSEDFVTELIRFSGIHTTNLYF